MPDHAHLVLQRTDLSIEKQAEQLKARATTSLNKQDLHPFHAQTSRRPTDAGLSTSLEVSRPASVGRRLLPSPWSRHAWQVYLNTADAIHRAIRYVEQNPIKAGYKPQRYPWVTHYTG